MRFYEAIAHYYDDIFKLKNPQFEFAKKLVDKYNVQSLLDIGCGTGAFAAKISHSVKNVEALDLDDNMVGIASNRYNDKNVHFKIGDMQYLNELYGDRKFDMITCFGNTLVHLEKSKVQDVIHGIRNHLNGILLMQILNYDYILDEGVTTLPDIDNDKIAFKRFYDLKNPDKILFKTELTIKADDKFIDNTIYLYPIRKKELDNMLKKAGFNKVIFYKNYNGDGASGQHLPLIVVAK